MTDFEDKIASGEIDLVAAILGVPSPSKYKKDVVEWQTGIGKEVWEQRTACAAQAKEKYPFGTWLRFSIEGTNINSRAVVICHDDDQGFIHIGLENGVGPGDCRVLPYDEVVNGSDGSISVCLIHEED